ncbi:alpha/beta hydrolase family protein, partial [Trifolium medium]|nr:alpha/beta hydrolase family protein [Trifolium medium]
MEARLDALGREMRSIKLTLSDMLMEQKKAHDQLVAMLTKAMKRTDDGERKIEASENRSTPEVRTKMGLRKPEVELFGELQQPLQNVILQKTQETVKEVEQNNVVQSRKMKMSDNRFGDDKSKFGEVVIDSRSLKCPVSIVLPPKALDRKPGITGKETQAASCSVTVSPPPKPPDADRYTMEAEIHIADGSAMVPPPPKPPETLHVDSEETGLRVFVFSQPQTTPMKRCATRRGSLLTEEERFNLASVGKVLEKAGAEWVIGSANAVEVAYSLLPQYHVRADVFYIAIFEFKRLSKTREWIIKREREDVRFLFVFVDNHGAPLELFEEPRIKLSPNKARLVTECPSSLPSRVKNILTNVLTLLDFTSHGCSWFLKGNFNFPSIVMRCMDEHYAAANMGVDLKLSFSYAALWMSCSKGIGIAG